MYLLFSFIANGPIDKLLVLLKTNLCPLMTSKLIHSCFQELIKRGPSGTNLFPDNNQLISMAQSYRAPTQNMTWSRTHSIQVLFHLSISVSFFLFMLIFKISTVKVRKINIQTCKREVLVRTGILSALNLSLHSY